MNWNVVRHNAPADVYSSGCYNPRCTWWVAVGSSFNGERSTHNFRTQEEAEQFVANGGRRS